MPEVGDLLCFENLSGVVLRVLATGAATVLIASFSLGEAFTVELQTVYFRTLAPLLLPGREVQLVDCPKCLWGR